MTAQTTSRRGAWEDRFRQPNVDELIRSMPASPGADLLKDVRQRLLALEGVTEKLEWQGVPWRWSLVYTCGMDPTRAFAYLIPDPARAQLAIPLTATMVQALPLKRMKKAVRDGVLFSRFVAGVHWPCWQLDTIPQPDEVMEIIQRKYRGVMGEWSGARTTNASGGAGGASSTAAAETTPATKPASKKSDNAR